MDWERKAQRAAHRGKGESGGASQILMDDKAPVLGRAMGTSARGGGARLRWLR
jgi:hypothetical protein